MKEIEQTWDASATRIADETKDSVKESLFKRMLRKVFPDQRKQSRFAGAPLLGYLGTMRGSRPFEVGDVGLGGFSLVTEERWEPVTVQATAVRWTEDGVAFSIVLFEEDSKAVSDNPLQVCWASRQEMKLFLERLKGPAETRAANQERQTQSADEGSLQAALSARFQVSAHTAGD